MKVRLAEPTFGEEEIEAAVAVLRSTMVTSGDKVREFESRFGSNAVMCNSGSSANLLAVAAMCNPLTKDRLCPGDEVIVPALSWSTTIWPLVQYGLIPKIVDIDPATLNMDPELVERAVGPRTRAVMPVHVYGNPCDMDRIGWIAKVRELWLIEDCCEALGSEYMNLPVGDSADFATYSFYFSHHITTLEGGMCVADGMEMGDMLRVLSSHGWSRDIQMNPIDGIDPRFTFINAGYNLRATELQAAIGLVQLEKLESFLERRRRAASLLRTAFATYNDSLQIQHEIDGARSSWFGFPIITEPRFEGLRAYFESRGIETRAIICGNIARQPGMKLWPHCIVGTLEHADHVMRNGFSIGCHQAMDEEACAYVAAALEEFMAEKAGRAA